MGRVGVGAGIVANGRSLGGHHGHAGEVGHNVVDPSGPRCHCGKRGCVETYIGEKALLKLANRRRPPTSENVAALWAFDVASDGSLSQARKIHDFGGGRGPDGMTLDRDGRVWVTAGTGAKAGVYVFQLDAPRTAATLLAFLPLPDQPTNCTFGGAERDVLYITTDSALFRVRTLVSGAPTPPGK